MSLKAKIESLNIRAASAREIIRSINMSASKLNGVAAVIPQDVPAPASYFKGNKVVLHNVAYDQAAGCISAVITFPYGEDHIGRSYAGRRHRFNIDEKWFKD